MNTADQAFIPDNLRFSTEHGPSFMITQDHYLSVYLADIDWLYSFKATNSLPNFINFGQQTFSYYG